RASPATAGASFCDALNLVLKGVRILLNDILARRCNGLRFQVIQRANVADNLPDLIFGDSAAPCGHPVRTTLHDSLKQISGLAPLRYPRHAIFGENRLYFRTIPFERSIQLSL